MLPKPITIHKRFLQPINAFATPKSLLDITGYSNDTPIMIDPSICSFRLVEGLYESEEEFVKDPYKTKQLTFSSVYHFGIQYLNENAAQQAKETNIAKTLMNSYPDSITAIHLANGMFCAFRQNEIYIPFVSGKETFTLNELAARKNEFEQNKGKYTVDSFIQKRKPTTATQCISSQDTLEYPQSRLPGPDRIA